MSQEDSSLLPPPLDWRGSRITIGCRVLYARDGIKRLGRVTEITLRDSQYRRPADNYMLRVRWQEDAWINHARPELVPRLGEGKGIVLDNITVWPDATCTHRLAA